MKYYNGSLSYLQHPVMPHQATEAEVLVPFFSQILYSFYCKDDLYVSVTLAENYMSEFMKKILVKLSLNYNEIDFALSKTVTT